MKAMMEQDPSPTWQHDVRKKLLKVLQACDVEESSSDSKGVLFTTLKSLYHALIHLKSLRGGEEYNIAGASETLVQIQEPCSPTSETSIAIPTPYEVQDFLYYVAKELINLDRVILLVDEEIEGEQSLDTFDYKNDCIWYNDTLKILSQIGGDSSARVEVDIRKKSTDKSLISCDGPSVVEDIIGCDSPERWIDKCLDICGYAISLEAAVDCLREIVHRTSSSAIESSSNDVLKRENFPGVVAAITSLRTVRRRLLLPSTPMLVDEKFMFTSLPEKCKGLFMHLKDNLGFQRVGTLFEYMVLPLEYHHNQQIQEQQQNKILSESFSILSTSVVPTLVSSVCHVMKLPLPSWAAPKISNGILFHSAWKIVLAGELLGKAFASQSDSFDHASSVVMIEVASNHFQMLVRQMIESGRTDKIVKHLYKCWKSCDAGDNDLDPSSNDSNSPRSILCKQFQSAVSFITSKREVAIVYRAILRYCIKQEIPKTVLTSDQLDTICRSDILPFLRELLVVSLSKDTELAEAVVHYIILSPPASFQYRPGSSSQPYSTLQTIDRAIPRCLAQLLSLACSKGNESISVKEESDSDDDDEEDSLSNIRAENSFLSYLSTVASVWCEDIFCTRTDSLQQQYVTEYLLQPLECKQLSQNDLQKGLSDDGIPLATMLVQGVTLRLDVSRSESIRVDGMRVAEAMASLLGQTLRFDELHPDSNDVDTNEVVAEEKAKKMKKGKRKKNGVLNPKVSVVVDPDTFTLDDGSESSDSQDLSDVSSDSNSSWGEDSLQPYLMDDDEEDLRRVPRPRTLRDCLAYLLISENDDLAYDKHHAALSELTTIIAAQPLDLLDVVSTLVRVLLFLEDKFSMGQFAVKRMNSLLALGVNAPLETCMVLVGEMRGNISLANRIEALTLLRSVAEELSGMRVSPQQEAISISSSDKEVINCSTRLRIALDLNETLNEEQDASTELTTQTSKIRRWRKPRRPTTTTTNRFGSVSVQMIYSLFAFLSQTKSDESIWSGPTGEKFLCEFLKTLSIMLYCARTYPSPALGVLAVDLFDLAWSFHSATSSEVRYAALLAIATIVPLLPLEFVMKNSQEMSTFLNQCSNDDNAECRQMAKLIAGSMSESLNQNMIERAA